MQTSQDQAGYYPDLSHEQLNELEQIQFDLARQESVRAHMEVPPTPFSHHAFGDDGASSSYPPPAEDPSQTPHAVDPTDGPRRSQRARVDTSRFSHSQYPDHHVYSQRGQQD
jgi:hypothetical protein